MSINNKDILMEIFKDMDDFAKLRNIYCSPIFLLGGAGCIMGEYLKRATTDVDFLDMHYSNIEGKLFRLLGNFDLMDLFVTTVAPGFAQRAMSIPYFTNINIYVLSIEDIIVSKLGRFSPKDEDDIFHLIKMADKSIINELIEMVKKRTDISQIIRHDFNKNISIIKELYNV